jgi:DNA-binding transcriptional MerR regulator
MEAQYTPQELVELVGISLDTLRYYERIGLIDPVPRSRSGHRRYRTADVTRLHFLKKLKATGMSLHEMAHYVDLFRQGDSTIGERRHILEIHRANVLAQLQVLHDTIELLNTKISNYQQQELQLQESL